MTNSMVSDENQSFPSLTFRRPRSKNRAANQPSYSPEDMTKAVEEARRETELRVEEETRATLSKEHLQRQTEALESIRDQLKANDVLFEQWLSESTSAVRELAKMIGQALVPRALDQNPLADIDAIIRQSLLQLLEQPKVEIYLGIELSGEERSLIEKMKDEIGFLGELNILNDSELNPGDVKLSWQGGSIERNLEKLKQETDTIIDAWILHSTNNGPNDQISTENNQNQLTSGLPMSNTCHD